MCTTVVLQYSFQIICVVFCALQCKISSFQQLTTQVFRQNERLQLVLLRVRNAFAIQFFKDETRANFLGALHLNDPSQYFGTAVKREGIHIFLKKFLFFKKNNEWMQVHKKRKARYLEMTTRSTKKYTSQSFLYLALPNKKKINGRLCSN